MDHDNNYYSVEEKLQHRASWGPNNWGSSLPPWQTNPEMPIWQYTAAALNHGEASIPLYYQSEIPLSPSYTNHSSVHSALNSPAKQDVRFISQPPTPLYDHHNRSSSSRYQPPPQQQQEREQSGEAMEDEEDSDTFAFESKATIPKPTRPQHRRSHSANEVSVRNAKRAHTVVEKNYRERLNDKINDLALYLFETSSDSRTKPSKSLVMTRAKERLKQLENRNKSLENEVVKLRQRIAILDHVVASGSAGNGAGRGLAAGDTKVEGQGEGDP